MQLGMHVVCLDRLSEEEVWRGRRRVWSHTSQRSCVRASGVFDLGYSLIPRSLDESVIRARATGCNEHVCPTPV